MKKTTAFILASILILMLSSCSFESNNNTSSNNKTENSTTKSPANATSEIQKEEGFNGELVAKNFEVTEYKINDSYSYFAVFVVKNTSKYTVDINGNIEAFNGESIVGSKEGGDYAVPPGQEIALAYSFDEEFTKTKYKFTAYEPNLYVGVTQDLEIKSDKAKEKEIITVTNNGTHNAEFIKAAVLFFKKSELVFINTGYINDSDPLKPKESKSTEVSCSESYDSIKVLLSARATK